MQKRGKGLCYGSSGGGGGGGWLGEVSPLTYETYILMNTINTMKTPSAKFFQEKNCLEKMSLNFAI